MRRWDLLHQQMTQRMDRQRAAISRLVEANSIMESGMRHIIDMDGEATIEDAQSIAHAAVEGVGRVLASSMPSQEESSEEEDPLEPMRLTHANVRHKSQGEVGNGTTPDSKGSEPDKS